MARIRTIKPDFWTDEKVVELSPLARLLFIGLWNFCDDDGRMVYSPKRLKMQIFPNEQMPDVLGLTSELFQLHMVDIYTVAGVEYLQVMQFAKHQKIDKRTPSKLPPKPPTDSPPGSQAPAEPPAAAASAPESHDIPPTNQSDSGSSAEFPRVPPTEGKGREGKGEELKPAPANDNSIQPSNLSTVAEEEENRAGETLDADASETPARFDLGFAPAAQPQAANDRAEHVKTLPPAVQLSIVARKYGVHCQPADPRLIELGAQGITPETLEAACEEAKRVKGANAFTLGFPVAILKRWKAEADAAQVAGAAVPAASLSIARKAELLGTVAGMGEQKFDYEQRVTREYAAFAANGFVKPDAPKPMPLAPNVAQLPEKSAVSEESRAALRAQLAELKRGRAA